MQRLNRLDVGPVIVEPDQGYAPIYALLRSPKRTLDLTMYKLHDPQVQQALIDDTARGVRVRVVLDKVSGDCTQYEPVLPCVTRYAVGLTKM